MKIKVKVKPNSKEDRIERLSDREFTARVKAKPQDGKANQAVKELLSDHFALPKSCIILVSGEKSRNKIFEIMELKF